MKVFLNGEIIERDEGSTLAALLETLGIPRKGVAVERNLEIVPRSAIEQTQLAEGDRIEIVQFVGGG